MEPVAAMDRRRGLNSNYSRIIEQMSQVGANSEFLALPP
jgi:hypothetical protein